MVLRCEKSGKKGTLASIIGLPVTENKLSAILSGISHSAIKSTSAAPDRFAPAAKKTTNGKKSVGPLPRVLLGRKQFLGQFCFLLVREIEDVKLRHSGV